MNVATKLQERRSSRPASPYTIPVVALCALSSGCAANLPEADLRPIWTDSTIKLGAIVGSPSGTHYCTPKPVNNPESSTVKGNAARQIAGGGTLVANFVKYINVKLGGEVVKSATYEVDGTTESADVVQASVSWSDIPQDCRDRIRETTNGDNKFMFVRGLYTGKLTVSTMYKEAVTVEVQEKVTNAVGAKAEARSTENNSFVIDKAILPLSVFPLVVPSVDEVDECILPMNDLRVPIGTPNELSCPNPLRAGRYELSIANTNNGVTSIDPLGVTRQEGCRECETLTIHGVIRVGNEKVTSFTINDGNEKEPHVEQPTFKTLIQSSLKLSGKVTISAQLDSSQGNTFLWGPVCRPKDAGCARPTGKPDHLQTVKFQGGSLILRRVGDAGRSD